MALKFKEAFMIRDISGSGLRGIYGGNWRI